MRRLARLGVCGVAGFIPKPAVMAGLPALGWSSCVPARPGIEKGYTATRTRDRPCSPGDLVSANGMDRLLHLSQQARLLRLDLVPIGAAAMANTARTELPAFSPWGPQNTLSTASATRRSQDRSDFGNELRRAFRSRRLITSSILTGSRAMIRVPVNSAPAFSCSRVGGVLKLR